MSDENIKIINFGVLTKKMKENNIDVKEDDLMSLFLETLENSENSSVKSQNFFEALSEAYGISSNDSIFEAVKDIADNNGDENISLDDILSETAYEDHSKYIYEALSGLGTDKKSLYKIINNDDLTGADWANIIQSYNTIYNSDLIRDIGRDFGLPWETAERNDIMQKITSKLYESILSGEQTALNVVCKELYGSMNSSEISNGGKSNEFITNILLQSENEDKVNALILERYNEITGSDLEADIQNSSLSQSYKDLISNKLYLASEYNLIEYNKNNSTLAELDLEKYDTENQNKAWTINLLTKDLNTYITSIKNQNEQDGVISGGFNDIKVLTGLGISSKDIVNSLEAEEQMIMELTAALNGESDLTFEAVFKKWTGREYDEEKIIDYKEKSDKYAIACNMLNSAQEFQKSIVDAENLEEVLNMFITYFGDEKTGKEEFLSYIREGMTGNEQTTEEDKADKDMAFAGYGGHISEVNINEQGQLVVTRINNFYTRMSEDEEYEYETITYNLSDTANMLNTMPRYFNQNKFTDEVKNVLSAEELQEEFYTAKLDAFGNAYKVEETVNKYCKSQDGFIDKLAGVTQIAGMGTIAAGGITAFVNPPAGVAIMHTGKYIALGGMFGDNIMQTADKISSQNGLTKEDITGLIQETAAEAGYLVLGSGINGIAEAVQTGSVSALEAVGFSKKSAGVISWLMEGGTDMGLSVLSDVMINGDMNLQGNSLQVLMGIMSGVASAKVRSYSVKVASADSAVKSLETELSTRYEGDEFNRELLKRAGFSEMEVDGIISKYGTDVENIHIQAVKKYMQSGCRELLTAYGIDTSVLTSDEIINKGRALESLTKNIQDITQDTEGTCAIVAELKGMINKPEILSKLLDRFSYDEQSGKWSCEELGIKGIETKSNENILLKIYESYKEANPYSYGDFATKVLNNLLPGGEDVIVKLTADNIESLRLYVQDESSILTFNTGKKVEGIDLEPNHSYTVLGFDEDGNITVQDPKTNKIITADKKQYEKLDAQIEGKTYTYLSYTDGSKSRLVAGSYETAAQTMQRIRQDTNNAFLQINEKYQIQIGERKLFLTEAEKKAYYTELNGIGNKPINPEHASQLVMSDIMLPEALAVLCETDISNCKTQEEVFTKLVDLYIEHPEKFQVLGIDESYTDAYLSRNFDEILISQEIGGENMGGDKIVHEICTAIERRLENDLNFSQKWSQYCSQSEVYKKYSALVNIYDEELKAVLGENYNMIESANHLIFRVLQRDSVIDLSSFKDQSLLDIKSSNDEEIKTFIDKLSEVINQINSGELKIKYDKSDLGFIDFMEGELLVYKTADGSFKIGTYEYKYSSGQTWSSNAPYLPQTSSW